MTALSVVQAVCPFIGVDVPGAVFSSTTREHVELKAVANDVADMIAKAHPWQLLTTLKTHTGDGTTEDFDLLDAEDRNIDDSLDLVAEALLVRRTALEPRRRPARGHKDRDRPPAPRPRRHDDLRHP